VASAPPSTSFAKPWEIPPRIPGLLRRLDAGYRFIAPVQAAIAAGANGPIQTGRVVLERAPAVVKPAPAASAAPGLPPRKPRLGKPLLFAAVSLLLVIAAVAVSIALFRRGAADPQIRSVAVLPLENLFGDPQQEYLSDGLTDAIATGLAQIADLRVISRTTSMHYKHTQKTTPEIARELDLDALIEGSVVRSGNRLRLNVELIQGKNDRQLWAHTYERELANVLGLQGELAREIAGQVKIRLTREQEERFARTPKVDPETYTLYLQDRFYWQQRNEASLTKAIGYFAQSIARDPDFAPAYAGLADAYVVLPFFPQVRRWLFITRRMMPPKKRSRSIPGSPKPTIRKLMSGSIAIGISKALRKNS
jgi:TolB-like protein